MTAFQLQLKLKCYSPKVVYLQHHLLLLQCGQQASVWPVITYSFRSMSNFWPKKLCIFLLGKFAIVLAVLFSRTSSPSSWSSIWPTHTQTDRGSSWHSVPWYMGTTTTTASKCTQWLTLPARVKKNCTHTFAQASAVTAAGRGNEKMQIWKNCADSFY